MPVGHARRPRRKGRRRPLPRDRRRDSRGPSLRISEYYRRRLAEGTATPEEREYIKRKINAAQWLIESIEQRRNTLTKVAQAIVDYQTRFLDEGPEHIEPLKMQQIADQVGVHVTTVSRAVDDKWIQTPRGILPLRRFFVGGTHSDDGEDVAWDIIRIKLQEVVDNEDKTNPFSDDELVVELKKHGLTVARRTITKYRQKMDIPSSRQRRDWSDGEPASIRRRGSSCALRSPGRRSPLSAGLPVRVCRPRTSRGSCFPEVAVSRPTCPVVATANPGSVPVAAFARMRAFAHARILANSATCQKRRPHPPACPVLVPTAIRGKMYLGSCVFPGNPARRFRVTIDS